MSSSSLYDPDEGANPSGVDFIALLSQRDLSLQIPINFVTVAGITTTSACFAHKNYEDSAATKCFSNLLAIGFRRLELDIFWDVTRQTWSFCPVQLGSANAQPNSSSITSLSTAQTSLASLSSGILTRQRAASPPAGLSSLGGHEAAARRQNSESLSLPNTTSSLSELSLPLVSATTTVNATSKATAITSSESTTSPTSASSPNTLIRLGPYSCTTTTFSSFVDVVAGHLARTETNLNATTTYLILNLHAAANASAPEGSAAQPLPGAMPRENQLLSSILLSNLSAYLYSPAELGRERADLNDLKSWFGVPIPMQPNSAYFAITNEGDHRSSTQEGWPSESFIEMNLAKRLLAGFGSVDPQMRSYNFSGDASAIFPADYLDNSQQISLTGATVSAGCIFDSRTHSLRQANSSWATHGFSSGDLNVPLMQAIYEAGNLTSCGISPLLNGTLASTTADLDFARYQNYASSNIWSWAPGEPRNNSDISESNSNARCAALNGTMGRWVTANCNVGHYGACRVANMPYSWQISGSKGVYANVDSACPSNTSFDVPRTAMENQYLLSVWRGISSHSDNQDALLWVNFNDLNANTCWVVGQNSTCPYLPAPASSKRQVVVPVVAAVIVFVLAGLTVFVKCAANRQSSRRRRRRGDDGWDYEGVPA